jgi:CubicO group peptidase (beta-lactamase class C family)
VDRFRQETQTLGRFAAVIALLVCSCAGAPEHVSIDPARSPDEVLAQYTSPGRNTLPGVAVSVIKEGKPVYRAAAGVRRKGGPERVTVDDPFHIGSDTKAMTALLCGILVDRWLLSWDATIGEVLGSTFPMRDEYRGVTLEQLLSHTAGLPPTIPVEPLLTFFPYNSHAGKERARLVREALAVEPLAAPGAGFVYSNLGYIVAGFMAEQVSGRVWETLMEEELFAPFGMEHAGFGPPGNSRTEEARAEGEIPVPWGHMPEPVDPDFAYADNPTAFGPAGTVHANLADLERYLSIYWNRGKAPDDRVVISESSLEYIYKPRLQNYGLGWITGTTAQGDRFLAHDGSNNRFYCTIIVLQDRADAVIVLANRGDGPAERRVTEIAWYLAERFLEVTLSGGAE